MGTIRSAKIPNEEDVNIYDVVIDLVDELYGQVHKLSQSLLLEFDGFTIGKSTNIARRRI